MSDLIEPILENVDGAPGVILKDGDASTAVTAWITKDGGDDVPTWGQEVLHIQIDTDVDSDLTGYAIHLNDGPPIYEGDPEQHSAATEVLREVREALNGPDIDGEWRRLRALRIIKQSGVIL